MMGLVKWKCVAVKDQEYQFETMPMIVRRVFRQVFLKVLRGK